MFRNSKYADKIVVGNICRVTPGWKTEDNSRFEVFTAVKV
jgi:hypothetical protein